MTPPKKPINGKSLSFHGLEKAYKKLWENETQDVGYRDNVSVTQNSAITMCSGGYCASKSVKEWVELAFPKSERGLKDPPIHTGNPEAQNIPALVRGMALTIKNRSALASTLTFKGKEVDILFELASILLEQEEKIRKAKEALEKFNDENVLESWTKKGIALTAKQALADLNSPS